MSCKVFSKSHRVLKVLFIGKASYVCFLEFFREAPHVCTSAPPIESIVIAILLVNEGVHALQRKSDLCTSRKETARPQFPHSCICEGFTYSHDPIDPPIFLRPNRQIECGNIAHRNMNVGIGSEAAQFHFWKFLLRIFGILSLQCEYLAVDSNLTQFSTCGHFLLNPFSQATRRLSPCL